MAKHTQDKYQDYLSTYNGRNLKHALSTYGLWRVRGEDPNCDMGGTHYEPDLGTYEGTLEEVIRYAVELPSFWQWGAGGRFEKVDTNKISDLVKSVPCIIAIALGSEDQQFEFQVKPKTTVAHIVRAIQKAIKDL